MQKRKQIQIPFNDLSSQCNQIKKDFNLAIKKVIKKGNFILGDEVRNFENEFSKYLKVKFAVGVASGTDALTIALKSLDLKPNDEVIVPTNVYPTAFGVSLSGVKIVLCDIDPKSLNVSVKNISNVITPRTKAVVVVHLYGNPVDLDPILKLAREKGLKVIEDCAQACGAEYKGQKVGTIGDIGCFSFYPTKNLGGIGDGGMIVTSNLELVERVRLLRNYGEVTRYQSILIGHNSRLDELQAAILRIKLKHLDSWNKKRHKIAEMYIKLLSDCSQMKLLTENSKGWSSYHLFVIQAKKRDELKAYLENKGIGTAIHYPENIHSQLSFSSLSKGDKYFPVADLSVKNILSLPLYTDLSKKDITYICKQIKSFYLTTPILQNS